VVVTEGRNRLLVGESGCGKTVSALTIMRILPMPPGRIMGGKILFHGQNLLDLDPEEMQKIRGSRIAMIFQDPMTSLNPVLTVGSRSARRLSSTWR
jgi:ABC-type dipeptide/oligopeptide/nickel transport system ATPase component